jgi:GR25 family glycosyltransferase involved in LPS biosynthesis
MQNIDKVVFINLNRREDRRTHMERILEEYDIAAIRFEAIEHLPTGSASTPLNGLYGCGQSHLAVLKLARDNGWANVLILEDDIQFDVSSQDFEKQIERLFSEGPEFDVCMLDINLQRSEPLQPETDWLIRVKYAHCAGAYIVKQHYYSKLIDLYEWALPLLLNTGAHWIYANDAVWGQLQEADKWITFKTQICRQMSGYSDTKNMVI